MEEHIRRRNVVTSTREMVDPDTGEPSQVPITQEHVFNVGTKDSFYLIYSKFLSLVIEGSLSGPEIKVFAYLLQSYGSGTSIGLVKGIKEEIAVKTKLKVSTIDNVLSSLSSRKHPVLFRKDKSVYYLNPRYAIRGSSTERDKQMRIIFELGCTNC